jgi:hypothetical protein
VASEFYLVRNSPCLDVRPETKTHLFVITDSDATGPVGIAEDPDAANLIPPVFNGSEL